MDTMKPFTTMMALETGELQPEREVATRSVGDMAGWFLYESTEDANQVVYTVSSIPVPMSYVHLQSSTTRIQPGAVGDEFFMTKGHFHALRDRGEIYFTVRGEGLLLMATEDGVSCTEPMRPGTINYVPGGWAHRSVNVGEEELVFLAVYVGDAGQDYATIREHGFPIRVVKATSGKGYEIVENPNYRAL